MTSRSKRLWGTPIVLALLTAAGLVSALLGDGVWDALSWLALTGLLATMVWIFANRRRAPRNQNGIF